MPKKGVKGGKYGAKKTTVDGIEFDSKMESDYYVLLKEEFKAGKIKSFERQPVFLLQPSFKKNGKTIRPITYIADFKVYYNDGSSIIIDVKGKETADFKIKRKMFDFKYPELTLKLVKRKAEGWVDYDEDKKLNRKKRSK